MGNDAYKKCVKQLAEWRKAGRVRSTWEELQQAAGIDREDCKKVLHRLADRGHVEFDKYPPPAPGFVIRDSITDCDKPRNIRADFMAKVNSNPWLATALLIFVVVVAVFTAIYLFTGWRVADLWQSKKG